MAVTDLQLVTAQLLARNGFIDAPDKFKNATIELLREVCNGCGAADSWFRPPATIYGVSILASCMVHDFDFYLGVDDLDFIKANDRFKSNMIKQLNLGDTWKTPLKLMTLRSLIYYKAVCIFGRNAFYAGKIKTKQAIKKVKAAVEGVKDGF
jgi:hypothetical protein